MFKISFIARLCVKIYCLPQTCRISSQTHTYRDSRVERSELWGSRLRSESQYVDKMCLLVGLSRRCRPWLTPTLLCVDEDVTSASLRLILSDSLTSHSRSSKVLVPPQISTRIPAGSSCSAGDPRMFYFKLCFRGPWQACFSGIKEMESVHFLICPHTGKVIVQRRKAPPKTLYPSKDLTLSNNIKHAKFELSVFFNLMNWHSPTKTVPSLNILSVMLLFIFSLLFIQTLELI